MSYLVDFDQAVLEVLRQAGQSPLGVFFMTNYLCGFPLTHDMDFFTEQQSPYKKQSVRTIPLDGCEERFWGAFKAVFGGRNQYLAICSSVVKWLSHYTAIFKHGNEDLPELKIALAHAIDRDAKLFLTRSNKYFAQQMDWVKMSQFYQGVYCDANTVRDDPNLRKNIHTRLAANDHDHELGLTLLTRILSTLDKRTRVGNPFIEAFVVHPSAKDLNWKDDKEMLEVSLGRGKSSISDAFLTQNKMGMRLHYAEVSNDRDALPTLQLLHQVMLYSNYHRQFEQIVGSILHTSENIAMAPFAKLLSMKDCRYLVSSGVPNWPLSVQSAKNFITCIDNAESWNPVDPHVMMRKINEQDTRMFLGLHGGEEGEGYRTKTSGLY